MYPGLDLNKLCSEDNLPFLILPPFPCVEVRVMLHLRTLCSAGD